MMIDSFTILIIFFVFLFGVFLALFLSKKSKIDENQNRSIMELERRITDLINLQLKEIRGTVDDSSRAMIDQVRSFTKETTELKKDLKDVHEKIGDISSFQDIFKSPKLRGQWGEASLEHILSQHFPLELYQIQYFFNSGQQVDAVLKLPNGKILPIDAKFSSDNFERMIRAKPEEKKEHTQKFIQDIKKRIEEISSKYISPAENTVDFALMFIPAEAIYYEIMFNLAEEDLASYAWKKRVVLTSPNTIYLTLRTIEHWFRDTQISKRTREILKKLERINQDAKMLFNDFRKLGRHLKDATSAYDRSEKRLSLFEERVEKLIETDTDKKQLKGK
jgi:DNA recombination protein RmuC